MTISNTSRSEPYVGTGAATPLPVPFVFWGQDEIEVIERVIATGVETVKALTTHYTVTGGNGSTGTVTPVSGAVFPVTVEWHIRGKTKRTQEIDYVNNDNFDAETHEEGLDRGTAVAQEIELDVSRSPKFPKTDPTSSKGDYPSSISRISKAAGYDADGKPTVSTATLAQIDALVAAAALVGTPVSAYVAALLTSADEAALKAAMNAEAGVDFAGLSTANVFTADQTIRSSDAGAGEGPTLTLDRVSASPAASDLLGVLRWLMKDSGGNSDAVLKILGEIVDATAASEDARFLFQTIIAGTLATRMTLQNGLFMAGATGGDQGAGTINATNFYKNGVALGALSAALLQDQKAQNTAGGTATSGSDQTRTINTEVFDPDGIVSISANQFTLAAGTYIVLADPGAFVVGQHQAWLYNVTDSTTVVRGGVAYNNSGGGQAMTFSPIFAAFTIAGSKAFSIRHRVTSTRSTDGWGLAANFGTEVYLNVLIIKLA